MNVYSLATIGTALWICCALIYYYAVYTSTSASIAQKELAINIQKTNSTNISKSVQQQSQKLFSIYPSQCEKNAEFAKAFDIIYTANKWRSNVSRSGEGSELKNVLPTLEYLEWFIDDNNITSFADVPCGDVAWQFSSKELNTMNPYFGADISQNVINENRQKFKDHQSKLFQTWDLTKCKIPQFKMLNGNGSYKTFDMVMTRDVIQHLPKNDGLKFVKNVVMSDIKYWAVTSYPVAMNGNVKSAGGYYHNNLEKKPFNLPKSSIVFKKRSHPKTMREHDNFIIFKVDEKMKEIVQNYGIE